MARNASGTHSLPTGNPVVSGTAASSTVQNATTADFSAEITDSLSRSGKGGMSAPLVVTAGSAAAPSIAPTGDSDTGIYASAANEIAITTGGTQRLKASSAGVNVTGAMAATGAVSGTTGTFTGAVGVVGLAVGSQKITGVADGTAATDAAAFGQLGADVTLTMGTGWTAVTGLASISRVGTLRFVTLSATAGGGAAWTTLATLPAGSRPASNQVVLGVVYDFSATTYYGAMFSVAAATGIVAAYKMDDGTNWSASFPAVETADVAEMKFFFVAA